MESSIEVKLVLNLTFDEYCNIIASLENEVNRLAAAGATCLCSDTRQLLDKVRESYLNGLCNEN